MEMDSATPKLWKRVALPLMPTKNG